MSSKRYIGGVLLLCLYIAGCGNDNGNDNLGNGTTRENMTARVHNIPNHGGPAISGVDISNPRLDRDRSNENTNRKGQNVQHTIQLSDAAANKTADLPDVDRAIVIVVDNHAYVTAVLNRSSHNRQTTGIEDSISRTVMLVDKDVDQVYVTFRPKFYQLFQTYARDIRSNRPVSKYYNDFSNTVRQAFPDIK